MFWIITVATIIVTALIIVVIKGNKQTKKAHEDFTQEDVIQALENVLYGERHDDWDLFLAWPIRNPELESIRHSCLNISAKYSGKEEGKDIATEGEHEILNILETLKEKA